MELDLTIVLTTLVIILGCAFGVSRLPQFRESSTKLLKERLKERDSYIEELKVSNKRYQNQYNNLLRKIEEEPEYDLPTADLSKPEGINSIIKELLPQMINEFVPNKYKPLAQILKVQPISDFAIKWFMDHPEQAGNFLGRFLKSSPKGEARQESESSSENGAYDQDTGMLQTIY